MSYPWGFAGLLAGSIPLASLAATAVQGNLAGAAARILLVAERCQVPCVTRECIIFRCCC